MYYVNMIEEQAIFFKVVKVQNTSKISKCKMLLKILLNKLASLSLPLNPNIS
jgi:hypothetical protein